MQLILTEDQELIAKTAADFLAEKAPLSRTRKLRDESGGLGYGADLWKEMAELGWVGIPFPESLGGSDLGYAEMVVVLEAAGRTLAPEPFLASLLASEALLRCGDGAQQARWLTPALAGPSTLALAFDEASTRFRRCFVETRAVATAEGFRIDGEKVGVLEQVVGGFGKSLLQKEGFSCTAGTGEDHGRKMLRREPQLLLELADHDFHS